MILDIIGRRDNKQALEVLSCKEAFASVAVPS
jgi:hypothetical protein